MVDEILGSVKIVKNPLLQKSDSIQIESLFVNQFERLKGFPSEYEESNCKYISSKFILHKGEYCSENENLYRIIFYGTICYKTTPLNRPDYWANILVHGLLCIEWNNLSNSNSISFTEMFSDDNLSPWSILDIIRN